MARNAIGSDGVTSTVPATTAGKLAGGAVGVPEAAKPVIPGPPPPVGSFVGRPAGPRPTRYRVMNGGTIVQNGCRTPLRAGKEIASTQYDIAMLKRQGIKLEELVDDAPAEQVAEAPKT